MQIDLYLNVIRRWLWLVLLMTAIAAGGAYYFAHQQPVSYTAQTQLLVGPNVDDAAANINTLRASTQVMQTYAALATTRDLARRVIDKLHLEIGPSTLSGQIIATPNTTTNVLTIAVHSPKQKEAVAIANAVAEELVNQHVVKTGDKLTDPLQLTAQVKQMQDQIAISQARINDLNASLKASNIAQYQPIIDQQNKIKDLEAQLAAPTDPSVAKQIADHNARIQQLQTTLKSTINLEAQRLLLDQISSENTQLNVLRSQVSDDKRMLLDQLGQERNQLQSLQTALSQQQNQLVSQLGIERTQLSDAQRNLGTVTTALQNAISNQVTVIDPSINAPPDQDKSLLVALIAGAVGLILSLTLAFILEYFDDRIRTPDELAQATGGQVWATVWKKGELLHPGHSNALATPTNVRIAEAFRLLCMRLTSNSPDEICSLLVSDLEQGTASAEIASNLAITMARGGKRVILVDANIQRPALGGLFQLQEGNGLAEWLARGSGEPGQMRVEWVPGLTVLPVGTVDGSSSNELVWPRMKNLLRLFQREADMVIVVGPPLSSSADAFFLASNLGGVLGVAQKGVTHWKQAQETIANLHSLSIQLLGVVFADTKRSMFKMAYVPRLASGSTWREQEPGNPHPTTLPEPIDDQAAEAYAITGTARSKGIAAASNGKTGADGAGTQ